MNIVFRVDASIDIGTGHVMRCVALADALRDRGAHCHFVCREHAGHLMGFIKRRGHYFYALPLSASATLQVSEQMRRSGLATYEHWLGSNITCEIDAQETLSVIELMIRKMVDWVIVDHYALDIRWERRLRLATRHLMVVDDLANRPHDCDVLLDQNLGRKKSHYANLLPSGASMLLGPNHALLRSEFSRWRSHSLNRRSRKPPFQHLLISMGGMDKNNATGQLLNTLLSARLHANTCITVVMGHKAPWLNEVTELASYLPYDTEVLCGVSNMAQLMAGADFAIGAAGSTSWERCCMGLPSAQVILAENQNHIALALSEAGASISCDIHSVSEILKTITSESRAVNLEMMSRSASQITDGKGVDRVRKLLTMGN